MSLRGPLILIVISLLLLVLIVSLYARHLATKDLRLFSKMAEKRKGKIVIDSFTSWANLIFSYKDVEVSVFQGKDVGGKPVRTCLKCYLNLADYVALHIAQGITGQTSVKELGQWLLVPKVQIGSPAFAKEFIIHGNDPEFLQRVVSPDFQRQFLALKAKGPTLYLHSQQQSFFRDKKGQPCKHLLEFGVNEIPGALEDLDRIIDEGLAVIDHVLKVRDSA
jgi:hypothetical protein